MAGESSKYTVEEALLATASRVKKYHDSHSSQIGDNANLSSAFISAVQNLFRGVVWNSDVIPNPTEAVNALSQFANGGSTPEETTVSIEQIGQALNLTLNTSTVNVEVN